MFELEGEREGDVLVSVAVCLEEDAPVSVFSLQEIKHEVSSVEEVNWKRLMCLCAVRFSVCVIFMSVCLSAFVCALSGLRCQVFSIMSVYCTFHRLVATVPAVPEQR